MAADEPFGLEPVELPPRRRWGLYDQILQEFIASDAASSRVTGIDK
jgi:hypothetical protein